jgi:hypothetical protein
MNQMSTMTYQQPFSPLGQIAPVAQPQVDCKRLLLHLRCSISTQLPF